MAKIFVAAVLAFGLLFVGSANAASARCEGCTETQFRAKAIQLGEGQHVISSFSTNLVRIYNVYDSSGGEPGVPTRWLASPVSVPADVQALFNDARSFYVATNATMKAAVVVRGTDLGVSGLTNTTNAYNVVTNFNLRGMLGDRLASGTLPGNANLNRAGEQIVQGFFGLIGAGDASIEVTVLFSDGSTVVYKLDVSAGTGQYQAGRSRTKNGQAIPESNSPDYQGTWSGGTDQPALANHMGTLGATIVMSGTGSGYGPMTCTWIGTTLTCKLQKK